MHSGHWAWERQRASHHVGALRAYARTDLNDLYDLRGPTTSPRPPCRQCAILVINVIYYFFIPAFYTTKG